jgi:hypothetical protein
MNFSMDDIDLNGDEGDNGAVDIEVADAKDMDLDTQETVRESPRLAHDYTYANSASARIFRGDTFTLNPALCAEQMAPFAGPEAGNTVSSESSRAAKISSHRMSMTRRASIKLREMEELKVPDLSPRLV